MNVPRKDIHEIRLLKDRGHAVIDRMARHGVPKSATYALVAAKLGCGEEWAHFQNRYTKRDVTRLLEAVVAVEKEVIEDKRSRPAS